MKNENIYDRFHSSAYEAKHSFSSIHRPYGSTKRNKEVGIISTRGELIYKGFIPGEKENLLNNVITEITFPRLFHFLIQRLKDTMIALSINVGKQFYKRSRLFISVG